MERRVYRGNIRERLWGKSSPISHYPTHFLVSDNIGLDYTVEYRASIGLRMRVRIRVALYHQDRVRLRVHGIIFSYYI